MTYSFPLYVVREEGLEPSILAAADFKSAVYTIPPLSHYFLLVLIILQASQNVNTYFGVPPGIRTPTSGFGDRYAAVTLEIHSLAEVVGFEPTDPFEPSVFKTAALSHAQPYFLYLVDAVGVEPTVP